MANDFVVLTSWKLRFSHQKLLERCFDLAGVSPVVVEAIPTAYAGKLKAAELREKLAQESERIEAALDGSKWILALGEVAFGYVSGRFKLKGWIGTPLRVGDRTVISTWEPSFLRGAGGRPYLRSFVRHVERIRDLSTGLIEQWSWPQIIVGDGNEAKLVGALRRLCDSPGYVGCDIETNGGELETTRIRCIGFGNRSLGVSVPFPCRTPRIAAEVQRLLGRDALVFQNGVFDIPILSRSGFRPRGRTEDLLHAHAIYAPKHQHGLAFIGGDETHADGWKALHNEDDDDTKDGWATTDPLELRDIRIYNAKDSIMQGYLFERIYGRLDETQRALYAGKMREDAVARKMHQHGFPLDIKAREAHRVRLTTELVPLKAELLTAATLAGMPDLNLNSVPQLHELYFRKFKVRPVKYDKTTGNPQLDVEALEKYSTHENDKCREFSNMLLNYRMHNKVLTTYIEKMIPWQDGNIHAVFKPSGAITGRWSAARPNYFNQPPSIRDMYIAREGFVYVGADYNALEGRTSALLARADKLLGWFADGIDIHTYNAKAIFGVETPTKAQRNIAKLVFFASIYGAVPATVWRQMNIAAAKYARRAGQPTPPLIPLRTVELAQKKLFETHPEYPRWHEEQKKFAEKNGFAIEHFSGRRLPFYGFVDPNVAINFGSQALAAEIAGKALLGIDSELNWIDETIVMYLYDEFGIIVPSEKTEWGVDVLRRNMVQEREYQGRKVRLEIEAGTGPNWKIAKP